MQKSKHLVHRSLHKKMFIFRRIFQGFPVRERVKTSYHFKLLSEFSTEMCSSPQSVTFLGSRVVFPPWPPPLRRSLQLFGKTR